MKNFVLTIATLLVLAGCKKETAQEAGQPDTNTTAATQALAPAQRFEPEQKSTETEGTVTLNNNIYRVVTAFTDGVAFKQEAVNENSKPDVLYYREKLVHLIHGKDTITLNKALFKKQLPDYDNMILQGVLLNHQLKTGVAPFMVYFCMPDSDYCYHFDVTIGTDNNITFTEVDEEDFAGYEE